MTLKLPAEPTAAMDAVWHDPEHVKRSAAALRIIKEDEDARMKASR